MVRQRVASGPGGAILAMKRLAASVSLGAALAIGALLSCLGSDAVAAEAVNTRIGDVAIVGYDPVAYFTDGRAVKGAPEFSHEWLGATWLFASAEHRDAFIAEPIRYAPQYGGFCALSVSEGDAANVDPEAWRIIDGRLYLFNDKESLPAEFDPDPSTVITHADANWPAVKAKLEGK
jgi:YHS domain-containing protein